MRKVKKTYLLFVIPMIISLSCSEVFEPKNLDIGEKMLVINGVLNYNSDHIIVSVNYSEAFGIESYTSVNDASVVLINSTGDSINLPSVGEKGLYYLNIAETNLRDDLSYKLFVETKDQKQYESEFQSFPGEIQQIKINAERGEKEIDSKNDAGEVITAIKEGIFIDASLESSEDMLTYVRFDDIVIEQSIYTNFNPDEDVFCVSYNSLQSIPDIEQTLESDGKYKIKDREIGFLYYIYDDDYRSVSSSARVTDTWILQSYVYTLNYDTYNYYKKINNQITAQNNIFDPTPSQILGNIKCITNPDEIVLGLFEVSRVYVNYIAYHWKPGMDDYEYKILDNYQPPQESTTHADTSSFDWISF